MSNNTSLKGFFNTLERLLGSFKSIGSIYQSLPLVGGILISLFGDIETIYKVLSLSLITIIWLMCFYIHFKRVPLGEIFGLHGYKKPAYSSRTRYIAFIGIFVIPILLPATFWAWPYYQRLLPEKIVVLVAEFDGPDPKNYRVTELLIEQLRTATELYPKVQIQALKHPITSQEGSNSARKQGKTFQADVVLWGWYGKTEEKVLINAHFEVMRNRDNQYLYKKRRILDIESTQLNSFVIQPDFSVVLFRPNFMLVSEEYPMKAHKNQ